MADHEYGRHSKSVYNLRDGEKSWFRIVTHVDQEEYDAGPFVFGASYEDGSLQRVIDSLLCIQGAIPEPYRTSARCEISSESGWEDSHYARIKVTYARPETSQETAQREAHERAENASREAKERNTLQALKAKYEA